jgi:hypothetical protein
VGEEQRYRELSLESALAIGGWIMIAATVLPFSRSDVWWVRIFDFPRLQVTLVFIAIFAMYVLVREDPSLSDNLFLGLLAVCLAYQLKRMAPYTPLARVQVEWSTQDRPERAFSILICNVYMENRCAAVLKDLITENDPHVIIVVGPMHGGSKRSAISRLSHGEPAARQYVRDVALQSPCTEERASSLPGGGGCAVHCGRGQLARGRVDSTQMSASTTARTQRESSQHRA